jgi:hypothetical protein
MEKLAKDVEESSTGKSLGEIEKYKISGKLIWTNFLIGLARGLGMAIGLTILVALLIYILNQLIDLPLIGKWIAKLIEIIEQYHSGT